MNWMIRVPAIALGVFALSSTAAFGADGATTEMGQHQAHMAKGMSHEDARATQSSKVTPDARATARAGKHARVMQKGMGHEKAREQDASSTPAASDADQATARSKKHAEVMQQGKGHEEARKASGTD